MNISLSEMLFISETGCILKKWTVNMNLPEINNVKPPKNHQIKTDDSGVYDNDVME